MGVLVSFPKLGIELTVNRVAFSIGGFEVYWYGVILASCLLIGGVYCMKKCRDFGIDDDKFLDLLIVGAIGGVIGARLYYVAFASPGEFTSLADVLDVRNGGLGFYGTVIGAALASVVMCKIKKVKLLPLLDLVGIGFLIGQGIGRWANFINQEAFGCNTDLPWGMTSGTVQSYLSYHMQELAEKGITVDPAVPVHPTFLYESLWCILGFFVLSAFIKHRRFDGELFLMYLAWNGAGRAVIEGLRTDSLYLGNFRISQLLAAVGCAASIIAVLVIRGRIKRSGDPEYLKPYGMTDEAAAELARLRAEREEKARAAKEKRGAAGDAVTGEKQGTEDKAQDAKKPEATEEK